MSAVGNETGGQQINAGKISDTDAQGVFIFGVDVSKIPCFRTSFLTGISSGVGIGLVNFLFTSNGLKSFNRGVYGYAGITFITWSVCRYRWSITHMDEKTIRDAINTKVLLEGTEEMKALEKNQ